MRNLIEKGLQIIEIPTAGPDFAMYVGDAVKLLAVTPLAEKIEERTTANSHNMKVVGADEVTANIAQGKFIVAVRRRGDMDEHHSHEPLVVAQYWPAPESLITGEPRVIKKGDMEVGTWVKVGGEAPKGLAAQVLQTAATHSLLVEPNAQRALALVAVDNAGGHRALQPYKFPSLGEVNSTFVKRGIHPVRMVVYDMTSGRKPLA